MSIWQAAGSAVGSLAGSFLGGGDDEPSWFPYINERHYTDMMHQDNVFSEQDRKQYAKDFWLQEQLANANIPNKNWRMNQTMDALYPETTAWERLGVSPASANVSTMASPKGRSESLGINASLKQSQSAFDAQKYSSDNQLKGTVLKSLIDAGKLGVQALEQAGITSKGKAEIAKTRADTSRANAQVEETYQKIKESSARTETFNKEAKLKQEQIIMQKALNARSSEVIDAQTKLSLSQWAVDKLKTIETYAEGRYNVSDRLIKLIDGAENVINKAKSAVDNYEPPLNALFNFLSKGDLSNTAQIDKVLRVLNSNNRQIEAIHNSNIAP